MLRHAHPVKVTWDLAGVVLGIFFLWEQQLIFGLVLMLGFSVLGSVAVRNVNVQELAKTRLGQWMLGQARPANLLIRTLGFIVSCFGIWHHAFLVMAGGAGVNVLGRVIGTRRA